jgi:hypothetical protein
VINLVDLLKLKGVSLGNYKIHLATGKNPTPLDAYLDGKFKEWQDSQNHKNFECDNILSLISLGGDKWFFAGVYKVLGVEKGIDCPFLYRTELFPDLDELIGRVIVTYRRKQRASYIWGQRFESILVVTEIKPTKVSIEEFPGYNDVIIAHQRLKFIIEQDEPSWKSALSNVKGIYLIADKKTGKMYVGKADGGNGIWQRWKVYINSGHGTNEKLKDLIGAEGIEYADNFQYSILEVADSHASDDYLCEREVYWKTVLQTRKFGYNSN